MDFIGYECPVCGKNFHADEDVVVCPVCGTPHHRECYESLGHCVNEEKHAQGYDFEKEHEEKSIPEGSVKCKACGAINEEGTFFCTKCNAPLIDMPNGNTQNNNGGNTQNANPFGGNPMGGNPMGGTPPFGGNPQAGFNPIQFDPMGGVSPDTEFDEGAKAGEVAKYVKQNPSYFMQVFNKIKTFGKSRFSFAGLFFGGGYLLYRKQYVLGSIITFIMASCLIFTTFCNYTIVSNMLTDITQANSNVSYQNLYPLFMEQMQTLSLGEYIMVIASFACSIIYYAMHFLCGFISNRCYYKHCCRQVKKIKANTPSATEADNELQTKGGVNTALAFSLLIVMLIINYVPMFIF